MANIVQLNQEFGIDGQLVFALGDGGMPVVHLTNDLGNATVALQGAHVLNYQAGDGDSLIWMSKDATYAVGKSLRGGVPICWPWFGPHASDATLPGHGPARTTNWKPVATAALPDGSTRISFEMIESDQTRRQCGHPLRVQMHVCVGGTLSLQLETTNMGTSDVVLGEALHTYFYVGDVRQASIHGLDGCVYIDKMDAGIRKQQLGDVQITEQTDRIYLATGSDVEIADPVLNRTIKIHCDGSDSVVVWNPWIETAAKMGDLGEDGYLHMLCVETTNAADDVVHLAAGKTHRMSAEYSSAAL